MRASGRGDSDTAGNRSAADQQALREDVDEEEDVEEENARKQA